MYPYKLKSIYNFNTHAPAILGTNIKNVKLLAILDYQMASSYTNPNTTHISVFPYLPKGTPNNPENYSYLVFETEAKEKVIFANVWIDETTIKEKTSTKLTIVIENSALGDEEKIRKLLLMQGYKFEMNVS